MNYRITVANYQSRLCSESAGYPAGSPSLSQASGGRGGIIAPETGVQPREGHFHDSEPMALEMVTFG